MTDYSGAISLSQPHICDDDTSAHSPRSIPASPGGCVDFSSYSKTPSNMIITLDRHRQQTPSSSENSARKPRAMKPVILEISAGSDIIDAIISYARRNRVGINIISVTGSVSNVTLRHPVAQARAFSLQGPFTLLGLSGSFTASTSLSSSNETPQSSSSSSYPTPSSLSSNLSCCFGATLAGAQGKVFGGMVGGKVMSVTQVIVVAATFVSSAFHRLPCESGNDDHHKKTLSCVDDNVGGGGGAVGAAESSSTTGMSMAVYGVARPTQLNCQISPDAMPWDPSSCPL
ncbi:Calcium-dependent lipid-binding family protein [Hibiscus syriacus]|uniref:Calcium-dependent lipid-binding family protein n=1 Tax=Hibiscus syriacus TaxID=106335 RepID=A0A6A3CYW1_HIBSY|nr:Calcium-dependent lipid-binding family protein [Hibiscus syriacus]